MIDRQSVVPPAPCLRGFVWMRNHRLQSGVLEIGSADKTGVDPAVNEHFYKLLAGGRACSGGGIAVLGNTGIFESHPLDAIEIDTVIVLQNAADPSGGGHGVSPYADPGGP